MTDDPQNRVPQAPLPYDEERPVIPFGNIPDELDMAGAGDIEIEFKRSASQPRPAAFGKGSQA